MKNVRIIGITYIGTYVSKNNDISPDYYEFTFDDGTTKIYYINVCGHSRNEWQDCYLSDIKKQYIYDYNEILNLDDSFSLFKNECLFHTYKVYDVPVNNKAGINLSDLHDNKNMKQSNNVGNALW